MVRAAGEGFPVCCFVLHCVQTRTPIPPPPPPPSARLPGSKKWVSPAPLRGGLPNVTDTAQSTFWYADELLGLPLRGVSAFTRQSLAGGWYGLLSNAGLSPNPDYFVALAYATIVGPRVLAVAAPSAPVDTLRVYAQCAAGGRGAVAVAWITVSPASACNISVSWAGGGGAGGGGGGAPVPAGPRLDYVFAPAGGVVTAPALTLNGEVLAAPGDAPPALSPVQADAAAPVLAPPLTFGFAVYPDAGAPACM